MSSPCMCSCHTGQVGTGCRQNRCAECRVPPTRKPRVIRKVVKKDAKGRAKVARDKKTQITMERIMARIHKPCESRDCWMTEGLITSGTEYAKVIDHVDGPLGPFVNKGKRIVQSRNYHFDCVPPEARPLVRFFVPLTWEMELVTSPDAVEYRRFTSVLAWSAWVDKNHPNMREAWEYVNASGSFYQLGTGHYWSALTVSRNRI